MSLENEEPHFPYQPTETNHEKQKKSKISYRREFLLSFSELDSCKKLPSGFDQSIISEFEDAFKDRQRTSGLSAYSFRRNEYGSSPPTRGDVAGYSRPIHGRWEGRSTGRSDRDSDSQSDRDSDSGRHFGNQSRRPLQVPEHDGLLGSGSFPRPAGFTGGISAPKVRSNEPYQLNRTNEPYHPPRPYKAAPHSRRDTDLFNDETFGSSELTSEERAEEERKRRASFELMRKEQHKALQEQKLKPEKNKGEFDFATLVDDSKDERRHRSSEVEEPLIPPAANTDSEKSSFLLQTAAPRPLVPPGFATTVLERNLGPKSLSDTREVEVGNSGLEENILRAKTKPVLNGTSHNQVEKQSTEQMFLSKQQHGSASTDVPVDSMGEKNQNLSPPQGALNKIIGIESQLYNIANTSQPVEVSRNSEVIDLNAEKVMRTKIVGESNQGPPASILEKLFTNAVALNGVGSSNTTEHQDSKDDETRSSDTAHSSKFAHWFHEEERKPSDDFSSGRQNDLLSLIVSGEKGGSGITAGKIRDHRFPSFSSQNSEPADRVMNSDVSPTVGSSEQLSKSNKPEAVSTVLTCEDLEQSILSGISENGPTLLPPVQKWSPPGAGGKPEQLKANVDNNASQHLLSLLQKGTGLKDMEPSYNQETMYFEKLHDTEGATIGTAVRISKNEISENVSDAGKNMTLETLFGTAFMKELQTVGAPVSVKRAPIGSARVDPMEPHSVPFPVTDNSLIPSAIQIGPNSTSHSSSDLTANRRKQTKSDMIEEQWLGLNNPHIELGSSSSQVGTDLGSKIGVFEGHPDFRLPEEDGLIAASEPLNIQNLMSSGNQVKSKLFSSQNTRVDIVEKLAAMNSAFKDERSMGSQEVPPFLRGRGPYDIREPDNPYQNLNVQPPSQQLHHPQLNHVGPPFHPLDSHPGNINSQMSFLGPKGIMRSDPPPNHQFHANMLRPPFHHSNTGQSGFDAHTHHPMMQQMRMQGNFPPPHVLQGLSSSPPQHPHPNLGATLPAQPVSQAFMQELNPMQGFPFGPQNPNFGGHGMPSPAPDAAGGSNHHPEALQRLIEMELRSNPKQIHQFPASGHTQGAHGHELDMGFGYR
ncbi:hypothetical protein FF1_040704 [Malus domestica]|uniref:uncharacterized protein LOC126628260 n=1 Tax=Malus sylvestris TaxID=3752 RepID=UPI0021ACBC08|nr:uncharacterized protein LOC126628260 [Malus sylvestris]